VSWDAIVIGAGPAGLSAALNLARSRRRVLVLDSNRPRNAATFSAHGYLSRDGISPLELRRLGREELAAYPEAEYRKTAVSLVERDGPRDGGRGAFVVTLAGGVESTRTVVIAAGLTETFPALPGIRAFYGTTVHSCIACDAYDYVDQPIALIGETDDLAYRALLLTQWSRDLIVFTNGVAVVSESDEERLNRRGVRVDRRPVQDVVGGHDGLTGILMADGEVIARVAAFVRPVWTPSMAFADPLALAVTDAGLIDVDAGGRTSVPRVYATGDAVPLWRKQLIVAAGDGAKVADTLNRDLIEEED
jgi:thioredoxin reductase